MSDQWQPGYQPGQQQPQPQYQQQYPPQGYGPPPGYYQPPQQPPRKSRKGWAAIGCLGLVGLVVVIAAVASHSTSSVPAALPTLPTAAVSQQAAPTRAAAAVAKTVATFSGSGTQTTAPFTVSANWAVAYSFDCSNFGYKGNFIIMEDGSFTGAMDVNVLDLKKSGTSYAYGDAGTHYLKVTTECAWTVKVVDEG